MTCLEMVRPGVSVSLVSLEGLAAQLYLTWSNCFGTVLPGIRVSEPALMKSWSWSRRLVDTNPGFTLINLTQLIRFVVDYPLDNLNSIIKINMQQKIFAANALQSFKKAAPFPEISCVMHPAQHTSMTQAWLTACVKSDISLLEIATSSQPKTFEILKGDFEYKSC